MSIAALLGARLGLEDLLETEPVEAGALDGSDTVEAADAEVQTAQAEVVEGETIVEDVEDAGETLDEVGATLESAVSSGQGLDPIAAKLAAIAINSATSRLGISKQLTASLENYGQSTSRLEATRITLEGVKETVLKWWNTIRAALTNLYMKIKGFFIKLFDGLPKLKARAEAMVKAANETKGTAKEPKIKVAVGALKMANATPATADIIKGLDELTTLSASILGVGGDGAKIYEANVKTLTDMVAGLGDKLDQGKVDALNKAVYTKLTELPAKVHAKKPGDDKKYGGEGSKVNVSEVMLGAKLIACKYPAAEKDGETVHDAAKLVRLSGITIDDAFKGDKASDATAEIATPTPADVASMAAKVLAIVNTMISYKALWETRDRQKTVLDKAVSDAISKAAKGTEGDDSSKLIKAVQSGGTALSSYWSKNLSFENKFSGYAFNTSVAALNLGAKALANHGAETGAKEEPAKEEPAKTEA